jgi:hypothetical protein
MSEPISSVKYDNKTPQTKELKAKLAILWDVLEILLDHSMKRMFEKKKVNNSTIINNQINHLKSLNTKNTTTYEDGYQGSCLRQIQRCGLIKPHTSNH